MSTVKVVKHPTTGNIVTVGSNPEYGTIRVDSETVSFSNGYMNKSRRTAFIRGRVSDLKSMNFEDGQRMIGIIQRQESFSPFYDGQTPKINPSTSEVILKDGKEVYFQDVYLEDTNAPKNIWVTQEAEVEAQNALASQAVN